MQLYRSGLSTNKIGEQIGCHKSLISKVVKEADELRFRALTDAERATAVEKYVAGEPAPKIAEQLGVTSPAIYLALEKMAIPRRSASSYEIGGPLNHDYFSTIDMPDRAYWLGWMVTDGCVTRKCEIILSLQAGDAAHLELFRSAVGSQRKITISEKPKQFGDYHWQCRNARFVVQSRRMAAHLNRLGVTPAKTGRTIYPPGIPAELRADFWRGAVEGDGWLCFVKSNERQQLVLGFTGDLPLMRAFQSFVSEYTPTQALITRNGPNLSKFQITDSFAYAIAKELYGDASVCLKRKHDVFLDAQRRALQSGR